jgi:single-stranded DNA-binding protein
MLTITGEVRVANDVRIKEIPVENDGVKKTVKVAEFSVVFSEQRKTRDGYDKTPHFFDAVVWDTAAEYVEREVKKGDTLAIYNATPRQETWPDKATNEIRKKTVIRINKFGHIPKKNRDSVDA